MTNASISMQGTTEPVSGSQTRKSTTAGTKAWIAARQPVSSEECIA